MSSVTSADKATFTQVCAILERQFHVARVSVTPATALADLGLDSLRLLTFVCQAENAFHVRLDPACFGTGPSAPPLDLNGLCELLETASAADDGWPQPAMA